jgi:dUTP pyrophosphatase
VTQDFVAILTASPEEQPGLIAAYVARNANVPHHERLAALEQSVLSDQCAIMRLVIASNAMDERMRGPVSVKVKTLHPNAFIPSQKYETDAAVDLHYLGQEIVLFPGRTEKLDTGLAIEVPPDTYGCICARSSSTLKGIAVAGVLDHGYTGPVYVLATNMGVGALKIESGARIGQLIVLNRPRVKFELVDELSESARAEGGFGSTGR